MSEYELAATDHPLVSSEGSLGGRHTSPRAATPTDTFSSMLPQGHEFRQGSGVPPQSHHGNGTAHRLNPHYLAVPQDTTSVETMEHRILKQREILQQMEQSLKTKKEEQDEKKTPSMKFGDRYTTKKTIGKSMLDFGLLMMNVAQLKLLVNLGPERLDFFWPNIVLITISILLQLGVGVILTILGAAKVKTQKDKQRATTLNNTSLGLIFIITTINTIVAAIGVSDNNPQLGVQHNVTGFTE